MKNLNKDELVLVSGSSVCCCRVGRSHMITLNIKRGTEALASPEGCRRACCDFEEFGISWAYYLHANTIKDLGTAIADEAGNCT